MRSNQEFEIFPWNELLETGISSIDVQHKRLAGILNKLGFFFGHLAEPAELDYIFDELIDYCVVHFSDEEKIWSSALGDVDIVKAHHNTHDTFTDEVNAMRRNERGLQFEELIEEILQYLSRWLVIHIFENDKLMSKIVNNVNKGFAIEKAIAQAQIEMTSERARMLSGIIQMYQSMTLRALRLMRASSKELELRGKG